MSEPPTAAPALAHDEARDDGWRKAWGQMINIFAIALGPIVMALAGVVWTIRSDTINHSQRIQDLHQEDEDFRNWLKSSTKDRYPRTDAKYDFDAMESRFVRDVDDLRDRIEHLERKHQVKEKQE